MTPQERARRVATDSRLSLQARRSQIEDIAVGERKRLGVSRVPSIECYLEQIGRTESASSPDPSIQSILETTGSGGQ